MYTIDDLLDTAPASSPPSTQRSPVAPPSLSLVPRDRDSAEWVDADARARIERDCATARAAGFATGVALYSVGTVVNSTGVANAKASRAEFEALPLAGIALASLQARIKSEARSDETVNVADLRMDAEGAIGLDSKTKREWIDGQSRLTVEADTLGPLCSRVTAAYPEIARPASLGGYLASCPAPLRAPNFNAWAMNAPADATAKLRTRLGRGGDRGIYAVVSESYAAVDTDEIAGMVKQALDGAGLSDTMRASVIYDGRRTMVDVVAHSNVPAESYAAGEIFKSGVRLTTDDTGGGAICGSGFILQNLCRNLIILHTGQAKAFRIVHKGNRHAIIRAIRAGIRSALDAAKVFASQWSTACHVSLADLLDAPPGQARAAEVMAASFAGIVAAEVLPIGKGSASSRVKTAVPALLDMWAADRKDQSAAVQDHEGVTLAALVNATTRYAHTVESDPWVSDMIERVAGRLLAGADQIKPVTADEFLSWGTTASELVTLSKGLRAL